MAGLGEWVYNIVMSIFGRKANQQSAKPDVPPELQPYFDGKSFGVRLRRVLSKAVPFIVILILIAGVVVGGSWLIRYRSALQPEKTHTTTQPKTAQKNGTSSKAPQIPAPSITPPQPATPSTPSTTPTPSPATTPAPIQVTILTPPAPSTESQTSTTTTIPNTGPGETAFFIALAAAVIGAAVYHVRQLRTVAR